ADDPREYQAGGDRAVRSLQDVSPSAAAGRRPRAKARSAARAERDRCWPERTSCRDLISQARIVIAVTGLVHAPGYRPHAHASVVGWPEKLGTGSAVQPSLEICPIEDHRHAVVNRPRERIGVRDNDRA